MLEGEQKRTRSGGQLQGAILINQMTGQSLRPTQLSDSFQN